MWESALFIAVAALVAWFWFDSLKAREGAVERGRRACERGGVQFLDESVECVSIRAVRTEHGSLVLRRVYRFEFSDDGANRRAGSIVMLAAEPESVYLEPYLVQ